MRPHENRVDREFVDNAIRSVGFANNRGFACTRVRFDPPILNSVGDVESAVLQEDLYVIDSGLLVIPVQVFVSFYFEPGHRKRGQEAASRKVERRESGGENGLTSLGARRFKATTDSAQLQPIAANLVARAFIHTNANRWHVVVVFEDHFEGAVVILTGDDVEDIGAEGSAGPVASVAARAVAQIRVSRPNTL